MTDKKKPSKNKKKPSRVKKDSTNTSEEDGSTVSPASRIMDRIRNRFQGRGIEKRG